MISAVLSTALCRVYDASRALTDGPYVWMIRQARSGPEGHPALTDI